MSVTSVPTHMPAMDPRYQYLMARRNAGEGEPKFVSVSAGYIPIFAKVSDLQSWKDLTEVQHVTEIKSGHYWIVTARIPFSRFEALHGLPFVRSLKVTSPLRPLLRDTVREIGLVPSAKIPASMLAQGGKHVVVGIVDFGCDFSHKHFIKPSKKTRIHSIWEQAGKSSPNSPCGYGRLYTRADINKALGTPDPYSALGYRPTEEHGTHVMDIAAGNGPAPGVAPQAKIMFVQLALEKDKTTGKYKKLTDSVRAYEAVKYIFDQAGDHPCVVNISLGQNGGAHDGTSPVEVGLDDLVKEKPNRAIVIAASNSYTDSSHRSGTVANDHFVDVKWEIKPFDPTDNELEVWYSGKDEFEVEIFYKDSTSLVRLPLDSNAWLTVNKNGKDVKIAFASHRKYDSSNGDNVFQMWQDPTCDIGGGIWTLRLHGKSIKGNGNFHAWIERDDAGPSTFANDDPNHTIGSISTGHKTIVVGSYDAHRANTPISYFSSAGPTRDGRPKPEVSAPGHDVWAAEATSTDGLIQMSGTSMAAPAVTGLVARILGQAHIQKVSLNVDQIRGALISTCRRNPPPGQDWDPRYGFGRIHADAMLFNTADKDNAAAQAKIGSLFYNTQGTAKDLDEAYQWYAKAANNGNAAAQYNLGVCLFNGQGAPKNPDEAYRWFERAANQGHASAQYWIGYRFFSGQGVTRDFIQAVQWFQKSADQGNAAAQNSLGNCFKVGLGMAVDLKEAVIWFQKAANQGNASAQSNLAMCYQNGQGVAIDLKMAMKWYQQAADQGDASAQQALKAQFV